MATKLKEVDVVLVGLGWTGGILAKELSEAGLKVVALERGYERKTDPDFSVPIIRDELRFSSRHDMMQDTAKDTITFRNKQNQEALPMRRLGSFLPGEGVGGAGVHWNGQHWRWLPADHQIRSFYEQRYGKGFIPDDMPMQDWGVTYDELEPYYDKFEYVCGVSGKAGNIKGVKSDAGNVFEGWRSRDFPMPPLQESYGNQLFAEAAKKLGYHPFQRPAANASQPYTNPDGAKLGQCQYCGHCERFGCESNAKGSPHITVIPIALRNPNFEMRTRSWVTKVMLDSTGKKATGVAYVDTRTGEEFEQPAGMVVLCAYAINNVHLMLLSGIGKPYDPESQTGVIGKSYCYQGGASVTAFFEDKNFNPFMGAGALSTGIDDFHANWDFDRREAGFIGGGVINQTTFGGRPIAYRPTPPGTPRWGAKWKQETAKWYQRALVIGSSNAVMPNRWNYYDLDPTYRNPFGQPLMRLTYNYTDNDVKMSAFMAQKCHDIAKVLNPTHLTPPAARSGDYSIVPYQSTHNTGGTIMGVDPKTSAVNRYLQSWDVPNVFVMGASVFPHNSAYNPTGPVGALTYWAADAIKNKYLKNPGRLIDA